MRRLIVPSLLICLLAACSTPPVKPLATVQHVDLQRYMGTWHVIARIPGFATDGKMATADEYHRKDNGTIAVTYHFRHGFDSKPETWHGIGWLPTPNDTARWKVRIIWPFVSDYMITALDPDYRYVMVGEPSRAMLWIMARARTMPEAVYQRYRRMARRQGFPVDKLRKVPQKPSQVGQAGFAH